MDINPPVYLIAVLLTVTSFKSFTQHISEAELKPLSFLVGEWSVETDMRLSKQGPWEKSEARSVIRRIVGESIFEEEYTGTKQGRIFTAKSWLGNDNRTKRYQKVFVDSDHGVLVLYEGELTNGTLTLDKKLTLEGSTLIMRSQYTLVSNDSFHVESFRSTDHGKSWDKTGSSRYSRLK